MSFSGIIRWYVDYLFGVYNSVFLSQLVKKKTTAKIPLGGYQPISREKVMQLTLYPRDDPQQLVTLLLHAVGFLF
jgi:hypothetical protein